MNTKRWILRDTDQQESHSLAQALSISPITASVLLGRGLRKPQQARSWLFQLEPVFHDPFLLPDMDRAITRLHRAVTHKERICFYGDYDVDGMSATSLYALFFTQQGGLISVYIPDRKTEGYGLNIPALQRLASEGVRVLVTVDCGTTSHAELQAAHDLGLDVIVTDHHQLKGNSPDVLACMNPHRSNSLYPFTGLCSSGIAYKVIGAYASAFGNLGDRVESFKDLVALATIADLMPLHDENRILVRDGLDCINQEPRKGIRALKQQLGLDSSCSAGTVAFSLAPALNACGRLAHAMVGVRLLTSESDEESTKLARELIRLNKQRREIERVMFEEAERIVENSPEKAAIVVESKGWHVGVVGIVAARLVERFHRPAVVLALDGSGIGKGSARGVPGFHICEAFSQCGELVEGFGGHPMAAGLTIREKHLPEFAEKFAHLVAVQAGGQPGAQILDVDLEVGLDDLRPPLLRELEWLQPFGMGNPEPTFLTKSLAVLEKKVVGDNHLKLVVRRGRSYPFEGIGFRMGGIAKDGFLDNRLIDLVFVPEMNHWNGLARVQLRIRDMRMSQV